MSTTTDLELRSCPLCGKSAIITKPKCGGDRWWCRVQCISCNLSLGDVPGKRHGDKLDAMRAAAERWNQRANKWTKDLPTEEGFYLYKHHWSKVGIAEVYCTDGKWYADTAHTIMALRDMSGEHDDTLWYRIEVPPLPENKENEHA